MEPVLQAGDVVEDRFEVRRLIGRGSLADVFEAHDRRHDRGVALKVLRDQPARDPRSVERLKREARAQQLISHRNVAQVYGGGVTADNLPYIVVELLQGHSLRQVVVKKGAIEPQFAASYAWQALQGLSAAHEAGIFHRDLKPANLMLEPSPGPVERVVLIDFGFANLEGEERLTKANHVVGSLAYMAPERLEGDVGSVGADLYAIGVILYELLAGRRPFLPENELQLVEMQLTKEPPTLTELMSESPPKALEAVTMKALSKNPADRAQSALEMAAEIETAMEEIK